MFRKLARLLGYEADPIVAPVFAFSKDDVAALASLATRDTRAWQVYLQLLDNASTLLGEALLQARDDSSIRELRGMILGLRKAARLVDETLDKAREIADAEQRKRDNATAERVIADATHYATPGWRRS